MAKQVDHRREAPFAIGADVEACASADRATPNERKAIAICVGRFKYIGFSWGFVVKWTAPN